MKDRWPIPLRMSGALLLSIVFLLSITIGLSAQIQIVAAEDSSQVHVNLGGSLSAKLLNFSPSNKILLKVQGSPEDIRKITQELAQSRLPQQSGIRDIRTIPIGESAFLLVVDFWERLGFKVTTQQGELRLAVNDQPYRNPLENWYRRGLYYQKKGDLKKALAYYRKVVFQNRRHGNAYFMAGQIRWNWKQYRLAEINFRNALRGKTDSVRVYYFLAELYRKLQNPTKAEAYTRLYEQHRLANPVPATPPDTAKPQVSPVKLARTDSIPEATPETSASADSSNLAVTVGSKMFPWQWSTTMQTMGGILVVGLLVGIALVVGIRGKMRRQHTVVARISTRKHPDASAAQSPPVQPVQQETVEEKKEKIMALFQNALNETPPTPKPHNQQASGFKIPEPVAESVSVAEPPEERSDSEQPDGRNARDVARQLNIGVGEVELALLMSSHQVQTNRSSDYRKAILQLRAQNKSIAEIARELNIGRSEVEIVLKLMNLTT